MIGLKRGTVALVSHNKEWDDEAIRTITVLKAILGDIATDIQHIGSTAIPAIKAKPIIDIAVAVDDFNAVLKLTDKLKNHGFYYRPNVNLGEQLLFAKGSFYDGTGDEQTHFVHIVKNGSKDFADYVNFRNYLIANPDSAKEYEKLKIHLAEKAPKDAGREMYLNGKQSFITTTLRKALAYSYLGKTVKIIIDRPKGYCHVTEKGTIVYPVNYGYVEGVFSNDGEEIDVYLLGVDTTESSFCAKVIGIVHRKNDVEDKLVAVTPECVCYQNDIANAVHFQERFFNTAIECIYEKSAGAVVYTVVDGSIKYLLIKSANGDIGFPKGHIEHNETETKTALREIFEETSVKANIVGDFRQEITYTMPNGKSKTVVYFTAEYCDQTPKHNDGFENNEYIICGFERAMELLTFNNAKDVLFSANNAIKAIKGK